MLRHLTPNDDPRLMVDATTGDDAAVWRLDDDRVLIVTVDFITPIVDDAFTWGRIAAANAVSDVYAMGGKPLLALNLCGWNRDELSTDLLGEVLAGAASIASEGGFLIAGGHTVDDPEPKYGLAVVGEAHPDRLLTNAGLQAGQTLILTKPLGIGVVSTAVKRGACPPALLEAAVAQMTKLNAAAAEIALAAGATGATDVTGFGLLGHLGRAALESGVDVTIVANEVPILAGVRELADTGFVPGGSIRNLDSIAERVISVGVDETLVLLLADAQTSGGLVFGVPHEAAGQALAELLESGHEAAMIGSTSAGHGAITIV